MSRVYTDITLGHVRTQGDIETMQRHGLTHAGNVLNLEAHRPVPRRPHRPASAKAVVLRAKVAA